MENREKLHTGDLYLPNDTDVVEEQLDYMELLYEYNQTRPREQEKRQSLLEKLLAEVGDGCWIEPPFHANWGGHHVHFGRMVYANYGLTMVDDTHIYVGDCTMFGPNVIVATAGHPILPELREQQYQYNILADGNAGKNNSSRADPAVAANVHRHVVVGAGSVVTRDLPDNVVAAGNPCRLLREIGERDRQFYFKDRRITR